MVNLGDDRKIQIQSLKSRLPAISARTHRDCSGEEREATANPKALVFEREGVREPEVVVRTSTHLGAG